MAKRQRFPPTLYNPGQTVRQQRWIKAAFDDMAEQELVPAQHVRLWKRFKRLLARQERVIPCEERSDG